jgi:hypothetical protein
VLPEEAAVSHGCLSIHMLLTGNIKKMHHHFHKIFFFFFKNKNPAAHGCACENGMEEEMAVGGIRP